MASIYLIILPFLLLPLLAGVSEEQGELQLNKQKSSAEDASER